jgi:uncharacterized protein (UPF0332 family)
VTEHNRAVAIAEELSRAENALAASTLLAEGGFNSDSVSRLYYSALFRVRALLLTRGLEAKSHEGALRLLFLHFVKAGSLPPDASHLFSRLMKYREEADYNPSYLFTGEDVARLREEVVAFAARVAELISGAGYSARG